MGNSYISGFLRDDDTGAIAVSVQGQSVVPLSRWDVDPTGVTDATALLNTALQYSADEGVILEADPGAIFLVSQTGTKDFVNPAGAVSSSHAYAVEIPDGARINWRGASLKCAAADNLVVLSNENTQATATGTATLDGTTAGLTAVTGTGWAVGQYIAGTGIQPDTTITAVGSGTLTLSKVTITAGTGVTISAVAAADVIVCEDIVVDGGGTDGATFTGVFTNGSADVTSVTVLSGTLANGQTVRGGMLSGAAATGLSGTIGSYDSGAGTLTLSATYTGTTGTLTVGTGTRTRPAVWLYGLAEGSKVSVAVQNCSYQGGQISACDGTEFGDLLTRDIRGQGWQIGGVTADQNRNCLFSGRIDAKRIANYGTFNQPGNGVTFGGARCNGWRMLARNCAGGNKLLGGCNDVDFDLSDFDGTVFGGESDFNTNNSGTKVQGSSTSELIGRVSIGRVKSRNCTGQGFYGRYINRLTIGQYEGYRNGRDGTHNDVDVDNMTGIFTVASLDSNLAGFGGVILGDSVTGLVKGSWVIHDCGDISGATNCNGIWPGTNARVKLDVLEIMDTRASPVNFKPIAAISDIVFHVQEYRSNINQVDIRAKRYWLGNPILSTGTAPLRDIFTPGAGVAFVDVSNANSRSQAVTGGFAEPVISIRPLNAAATTLGLPRPRVGVNADAGSTRTNFSIHFTLPGAAAGTELYEYRIEAYVFRASQSS